MVCLTKQWIHYQDDALIIVNKPGGLPSVPGNNPRYSQNLYHLLMANVPPVYVVHRLDINTSGLIIFARTKQVQRSLNIAFQERKVSKRYHALLHGKLSAQCGEIQMPLICDWPNRPKQKLCFFTGKPAVTRYRHLGFIDNDTLVEFTPVTGRSHQLRVHAQLLGHPIVGCRLYGPKSPQSERLMLHAAELNFKHPLTQQQLHFTCPADFAGPLFSPPER